MLQLDRLAPTEREAQRTHAREYVVRPQPTSCTVVSVAPIPERASVRLAMGQQLGERYRVIGFLGKGGMGSVYRVYDRVLQEDTAFKVVRGDHEHLRAEVRLAQQVTHHNVCRTYDLEAIDGQHYVKMEYIPGETLAKHLGHMSIAVVLDILRAVIDGLAAAHARGIVHRDLKPGNVMLDGERVVLVDFGLAQFEGESDLAGTPAYMSPEQLVGGAVDARSDLFALGCLAFAMLTGTPPYGEGTIAEVAAQQVTAPRPDVRARRPDVPRWLATAISTLLSPKPAQRAVGVRMLRGRSRRWLFAIPTLAVALLATGAVASLHKPPITPQWSPAIVDLPQYDENADDPLWAPDGNSILFSSDRGHRDSWAVYIDARDGADPRLISPPGRYCLAARWTRDGTAVLMSCFSDGERRILRQPVAGGPPRDLGPGWAGDECGDALAVVVTTPGGAALVLRDRDGRDTEVVAMPDVTLPRCDRTGEHILYIEGSIGACPGLGGTLVIVDRQGHKTKLTQAQTVQGATFTPDERSVVFSMEHGAKMSLYEVGVAGGAMNELTPQEEYAAAPDVSPDGRSLIYDRDRTSTPIFELGANAPVQKTFRFEQLSHLIATPDGRGLIAARLEAPGHSVVAIDLRDFSEHVLASGEALSIDAAGVVVLRAPDDPRGLQAIPLAGGEVTTRATLPAPILDAAAGPDGTHVELDRGGATEAWLVDRAGTAAPEGVSGLVMPAPAGGWRVVRIASGYDVVFKFVPPGRPLTAPAFERAAWDGQPRWLAPNVFAYCELTACHRLDVVTRRDIATTRVEVPGNRPVTIGVHGDRWFATSYVGHVTRHAITNFAERPSRP